MIRQAAFKGLREDKDPNDVVAETATMSKPAEQKAASQDTSATRQEPRPRLRTTRGMRQKKHRPRRRSHPAHRR